MSSAARDEFEELMRDKSRLNGHPEDDSDARSLNRLEDEDGSEAEPAANSAGNEYEPKHDVRNGRSTIPSTRYQANTGPKGVISDAQNYRDSQREHKHLLHDRQSAAAQTQQPDTYEPHWNEKSRDEEELDIGEEEDDEFMREWRQSRMRELQVGGHGSKTEMRERGAQRYGSLAAVDADGYLDAVEKSPAGTAVLVYIYDDMSDVSAIVEECLRPLAQKHFGTRFVKLHYQDAEMEPAGVPALLAYRNGDKFAGLVPITEEIPDDAELSAETLEHVLQRHQMLT